MRVNILVIITIGLFFIFLFPGVSAVQITISDIVVQPGGTATADVVLNAVPHTDGLAGYSIYLNVSNPAVAEISGVSYNQALQGLTDTSTMPFTNGHIAWVDTNEKINPGDSPTNIVLATVTLRGLSAGSTSLGATIHAMDGDGPNWVDLNPTSSINHPTIIVNGPVTSSVTPLLLPGYSNLPTDPDHDGLYEDLNGDGTITFTDTSTFFFNWHWIENNEPVSLFDYNKNGAIDFGDIILLNQKRG
jgi:PKD repeat protein